MSVRDRYARLLGFKASQSYPIPLPVLTMDYGQLRMDSPLNVNQPSAAGQPAKAMRAFWGGWTLGTAVIAANSVLVQAGREVSGVIAVAAAALNADFYFAPGLYEICATCAFAAGSVSPKGFFMNAKPRRFVVSGPPSGFIGSPALAGPSVWFGAQGANYQAQDVGRFFFTEEWVLSLEVGGTALAAVDVIPFTLMISGEATTDDVSEALQTAVTP